MKHKKVQLCAFLFLGFGLWGLQAQQIHETMSATGGNASGSGGSVSYSLGQLFYSTQTTPVGSVSQGVQQPYEISVLSGIEEPKGINLVVSAYPNPTVNYITLKLDNIELSSLSFQLYDMSGKLLESKKVDGNQTKIFMSKLLPATYFLKVIKMNKEVKTFKIVKN
jgi:hypothetical protein